MIYPSSDELEERAGGSRYALVIAVSKRARQIRDGAMPLVESDSANPITIALEEIAAGKLNIYTPTPEEQAAREEEVTAPRERDRELAQAVDLLRAPVHEEAAEEEDEAVPETESKEEPLDLEAEGEEVSEEVLPEVGHDEEEEPEIVEE